MGYLMADSPESKMRSADRVLILSIIDGKKPISSVGLTDTRLFNGENRVHAIMDTQSCLWYLKYEQGGVPEPLKCKFTSFKALLKFVGDYYFKRNIEIKQVID